MRIALIAPPWLPVPPPGYGGTEAVVDALARGLDAAGHEVLLCATGDSSCPVQTTWSLAKAVGTDRMLPLTELHHAVYAYGEILEWGADIVHDHTVVGPLYGAGLGLPVVTTNHGPFEGEAADVYRMLARRVPVIAISAHHASTAQDTPIGAVIHHGVDPDAYPAGRGRGGYALFLGRMCPDKGVDTAIHVARAAGMPLKIAAKMAEPSERDYFRLEIEPLLDDDVEFLGQVGGEAKLSLLAGATCLLNPLRWAEPFGMVMIEALACGTPVVARPLGSVPEIVDHGVTGFLGLTDSELVEGVRRAGSLDREAGRAAVRARFSTARMVADHLAFYRSVLARASGTTAVTTGGPPAR